MNLSYVYDLPFEGQNFQLSIFKRSSSKSITQTINPDNNLYRYFQLVTGYVRKGGNISYSQNLFSKSFPINVKLSYDLNVDKYFQIQNNINTPINQKINSFEFLSKTFSDKPMNFIIKFFGSKTRVDFVDDIKSIQYNYGFSLGSQISKSKTRINTLFKYNLASNLIQKNIFYDVDLSVNYSLSKKIAIKLIGENILQNFNIIDVNSLSIQNIDNNGMEYFQSFRNIIGFTTIGLKYIF